MGNTMIKDLYSGIPTNNYVVIEGWIRNNRLSKSVGFLHINDGSCFKNLQVIYSDELDNFDEICRISVGSSVICRGEIISTPTGKQAFEMQAKTIEIISAVDDKYPLQNKRHSFEFLRTVADIRARTNTFSAVFRMRSQLSYAIHRFFHDRNFVQIHTPIITSSDAEGAGEMFTVTSLNLDSLPYLDDGHINYAEDFFGKKANLAVSGQLNAEAYAHAFKKVYSFGPTFRAEDSNTTRHAAEFWMIEPEVAFADLSDNILLAEDFIREMIITALEECNDEMIFFDEHIEKGLIERLSNLRSSIFHRITYTEAIELLLKEKVEFKYPVVWGLDLQTEHEKYLTDHIFNAPVFVTDYPKDIKAFYMRNNDDGKTVAAVDLLVPGIGEILGGSQREERYDILVDKCKALNFDLNEYGWYLNLRKYGGTKHSGFGVGFERLIMYLSGMRNIRDVISFPRVPGQIKF